MYSQWYATVIYVFKFDSHIRENTRCIHYKVQLMLCRKIITVYCEKHTMHKKYSVGKTLYF